MELPLETGELIDGRAVPACGYRPEDVSDGDVATSGEDFGGGASAEARRVGNRFAETFMVRERSPAYLVPVR